MWRVHLDRHRWLQSFGEVDRLGTSHGGGPANPLNIETWTGTIGLPLPLTEVGVPDERTGEAVKLVVVRADPALTEAALLEHCRAHLTGYKLPRSIEFRSEPLPKTNLGKILRRAPRVSAAQSQDQAA